MLTSSVDHAFRIAVEHHQAGRLAEAETLYRQILAVQPGHVGAWHYLGLAVHQFGRSDDAVELIRRAIMLVPNDAAAHSNLGVVLAELGRSEEAIEAYRRALALDSASPETFNNLGNVLGTLGRPEEAIAAYRRALEMKPDYAEACHNLSGALRDRGEFDAALAAARQALQLRPDWAEAHHNVGCILRDQGQPEEALSAYRRALQNSPNDAAIHSNIVFTLHFLPDHGENRIASEQRRWNERFGQPHSERIRPSANDRDPERRLRVGYVSPDFRKHGVGWNLLPFFEHHDRENFEILCYSAVVRPDELTERFKRSAHLWRSTVGRSDEALAEMIRQDGVDILVDLCQHGPNNRLPVFARRPAPVQVSFGGYPESTGLEAIEYRISDKWLECEASRRDAGIVAGGRAGSASDTSGMDVPQRDRTPAGVPEGFAAPAGAEPLMVCKPGVLPPATVQQPSGRHRAESVFLLDSFWCYEPHVRDVEVNALPAKQTGIMTFGSLNHFSKLNEPLLRLWARVLSEVKASRLLLLTGYRSQQQWALEILNQAGVASHRVDFVDRSPRRTYLEFYRRVDMVLDPFPYNGHTTSLDALWMGVPVVSLAGPHPVSRGGCSQLSNLGLPELVAFTEDDYVKIAVQLANDVPRLEELRRTLRPRLESSRLMDVPRFARHLEAAYRAMWRCWCAETR